MIVVNNPFGQDPMDLNENSSADRVGHRIREIREAQGMTQSELGEKIGLNGDRVQKYENGVRKPKADLLKKFASALGVSTLALTDPVVANYIGAMYALFEMEKNYDLKVKRDDGKLSLVFGNGFMGEINGYIDEWEKECRQIELELEAASSEEERASVLHSYKLWKWNFPEALTDMTEKNLRDLKKAKLEEQMKQLQKELSDLNGEDGE
ncbi:MAG: helix-turn-helix transcriptional regulator [Butyrivibrio sp.]|nr:helix-turn-helix transcriptional regulator [Butyrivibrio sp.]